MTVAFAPPPVLARDTSAGRDASPLRPFPPEHDPEPPRGWGDVAYELLALIVTLYFAAQMLRALWHFAVTP